MVCAGAKPILRLASCCSVDVVNGACGLRRAGLASTVETVKLAASIAFLKSSASAPVPMSSRWTFLPSAPTRRASNTSPRAIDLARMLHRFGDRLLGDGVEHHAFDLVVFQRALFFQDLEHVPGDRFALAIGV